jgi:hypothetical protein
MPNGPTDSGFSFDDGIPRPRSGADENALELLWERGRKAWKDVASATGWVEELRGNQSQHDIRHSESPK